MARHPAPPVIVRTAVIGGIVVAAAIFLVTVAEVTIPFIFALIIAYALGPVVALLRRRLGFPRVVAVALVYLVFLGVVIAGLVFLAPVAVRQLGSLIQNLDDIYRQAQAYVEALPPVEVAGTEIQPAGLLRDVQLDLQGIGETVASETIGLAGRVFSILTTLFLALFLGFYLLLDGPRMRRYIQGLVPDRYRGDTEQLVAEVNEAFKAYLLGQVILALSIWVITTVVLLALGVPNAFILGMVAGLLEFVPIIGPIIAAVPAVAVAFFQGSTLWPADGLVFALIVTVAYIAIQQIEGNVLVPQVMGRAVDIHPVVVIFGVLVGANLAGIVGIFLAAPLIATVRICGRYIRDWLFPPEEPPPSRPRKGGILPGWLRSLLWRLVPRPLRRA